MNIDSGRYNQLSGTGVMPDRHSSPETVAERTHFLIEMIRRRFRSRPKGIKGIAYICYLFLIFLPCHAWRLYIRVFLIWPLGKLRGWIVARIVVRWIRFRRYMRFRYYRSRKKTDRRLPIDKLLAASVCQGDIHNVDVLLKRGANPSTILARGTPILLFAIRTHKYQIVQLLLSAGASPNTTDPASRTPAIWLAASKNNTAMVQLLLKYGASVDAHGITGLTALMEAAAAGNTEITRLLLAAGADPSKRCLLGSTAYGWEKKKRHEEIVKLFDEYLIGDAQLSE